MKIDLQKANAAIDEYLLALRHPKQSPRSISSLYWTKLCLERNGVIADARKIDLTDHCVLFAACILVCGRVREVSRAEIEANAVRKGKSLQKTLNEWERKRNRLPYANRIDKHLADTRP